jgi:hypothetical protein
MKLKWHISHTRRTFLIFRDCQQNIVASRLLFETSLKSIRATVFTDTISRQPARRGGPMRVRDHYWLDYDVVAFAVLMSALFAVELLVLNI